MIAPPAGLASVAAPGVRPSPPERATTVRPLDWDTAFFGSTMGVMELRSGARGAGPAEPGEPGQEFDIRAALTQAQAQGYRHLIARVPSTDLTTAWAVEQAGFSLVDIGLDSTFAFATTPLPARPTVPIRAARPEDLPRLRELAADAFRLSRFSADPIFSDEQVRDFHREWVKNLYGGLAQAVLVCGLGGSVAGFVTCAMSGDEGRIPLIATDGGYRRRGVGRGLVSAALRWFANAGARVAHVKTQSVNYPALALYHRAGFAISTSEGFTFSVTLSPVGEYESMSKRILVTGGAGYLGSVLVPTLLDEGYHVDVFDRLLFGPETLASVREHPHLRVTKGDLTRLAQENGFLEGVDTVIHLGGLSNDPSADLKPELTQRVNFDATTELARRAARAGVRRFLFASSCSVYGSNPSPIVDEGSELRPVSLYAQKKAEAEQALFAMSTTGMTIGALRMATLYGLSPRMRFDLAINLMVMNAVTRRSIFVLGGGQQWRPFLHVSDATQAFMTAIDAPAEVIDREVFNVGADEHNFKIGDLAWAVRDALPHLDVAVQIVPDDADKRSYRVGFHKIINRLGYRPKADVTDSILEIARAIQAGRLGDCSDTRYYTVKQMQEATATPAMAGGDPVRSEFLPFALPLMGREEEEEVLDSMRSGWVTTGPKTKRFEQGLADYAGAKHAIAVNSCTAALHVSLAALGVGRGDEVITTAITFPATANVVIHQGAKPVLVDVDPTTLNIDPAAIEAAITPRTRAIVPVHMAGQPADMEAIRAIAERHGLAIIEDAAHAIGAEYGGERVGNLSGSLAACYSFYPIKNMTTIEGGAILTNDDEFAERARLYTLHGISKDAWKRYSSAGYQHWDTLLPGFKYNMTDIQSAVGIHQLPRLEGFLQTRERYARMFTEAFADLPEIEMLRRVEGVRHAWHLFVILLNLDRLSIDRDGFMEALRQENIGTGIHFRSLHIQPFYQKRFRLKREDMPNAAQVSDRLLSLPLYPKMTERDVLDVIEAVQKLVRAYRVAPKDGIESAAAGRVLATV